MIDGFLYKTDSHVVMGDDGPMLYLIRKHRFTREIEVVGSKLPTEEVEWYRGGEP